MNQPFLLASGLMTLMILVSACQQAAANAFKITRITAGPGHQVTIEYDSDPDAYFILLGGNEPNAIEDRIDLATGVQGSAHFVLQEQASHQFYQVLRAPLVDPLDSDADGIDDLYENQYDRHHHPYDPLSTHA